MDLSSLLPPMKTCQNLDWLSFLFSFSMNFYSKVKHELNHSLCHFKPVNALLPVAGTGNTMSIKLLIRIYLLNYFSYWNSFNGHMTKFLSIMKQQEGEARWVSPRLARLPRYLEGVLMSSHMDDFFGWADFHHINLTLKVSAATAPEFLLKFGFWELLFKSQLKNPKMFCLWQICVFDERYIYCCVPG